jgi:hypothetical protein
MQTGLDARASDYHTFTWRIMSKLILRGCRIRYADVRESKAGVFTRIYMTADFSDVAREQMGWGEPGDGFNSAKLDGELNTTHVILTPNPKELRQHELQLDVTNVDAFEFVRVTNSENETVSAELRFVCHSPVDGASALVENYMRRVGTSDKSIGQLRINYEVQEAIPLEDAPAAQAKLEGAEAEQPLDTGCIACNNEIPLVDGDPSMHASGQLCAAYSGGTGGPALSTAREAAGGTHQKRKRGGSGPVVVQ